MSIQKIIGAMSLSYSLVLCSPFLQAQEAKSIEPDQCVDGKDGQSPLATCRDEAREGTETGEGDVLRVEYDYVTVQRSDGKELKMHIDEHTEMIGHVGVGQHVEAMLDQQKHALLIRLIDSP